MGSAGSITTATDWLTTSETKPSFKTLIPAVNTLCIHLPSTQVRELLGATRGEMRLLLWTQVPGSRRLQ